MKKKWSDLSDSEKINLLEDYKKSTGPIACKKHGVDYKAVRGLMSRYQPKGMGKGGKRSGSENKKGIKFCRKCKKSSKNCRCKKD